MNNLLKKKHKLVLSCCEAKLYENETCKCKYILLIKNNIKKYMGSLKQLPIIEYNKLSISYYDINAFLVSDKKTNDKNNKMRENIIGAIINNEIPDKYYYSNRWNNMKNSIFNYIYSLINEDQSNVTIDKIDCQHKGGRNYNFDFTINVNNMYNFNVELKFNAAKISDAPQFVSPMKQSQYLSSSYEEFHFDNFIPLLAEYGGFDIPTKNDYLNDIHSTSPKCISKYQDKYYSGCKSSSKFTGLVEDINFYKEAKRLSEISIINFIQNNELNIQKLSEYLIKTQKNKYYMMYKDNVFYKQTVNMDEYELISYEKQKNMFIATSKTGKKIKILLRWKNGNGIAFPAFQIS
jgi:hypothetical protein